MRGGLIFQLMLFFVIACSQDDSKIDSSKNASLEFDVYEEYVEKRKSEELDKRNGYRRITFDKSLADLKPYLFSFRGEFQFRDDELAELEHLTKLKYDKVQRASFLRDSIKTFGDYELSEGVAYFYRDSLYAFTLSSFNRETATAMEDIFTAVYGEMVISTTSDVIRHTGFNGTGWVGENIYAVFNKGYDYATIKYVNRTGIERLSKEFFKEPETFNTRKFR